MGHKILTAKEVQSKVRLSRTTIWRMIKNDTFPRPIKLSTTRKGWLENEINLWLTKRCSDRDNAQAA